MLDIWNFRSQLNLKLPIYNYVQLSSAIHWEPYRIYIKYEDAILF